MYLFINQGQEIAVKIATVIRTVYISVLKTPKEMPTLAMIISIPPRAFKQKLINQISLQLKLKNLSIKVGTNLTIKPDSKSNIQNITISKSLKISMFP